MTTRMAIFLVAAITLLSGSGLAQTTTRTWNGPANGDWFAPANWGAADASVNFPQDGDTVIVGSTSILLTNETAELAAFSITNASLIFTNWSTRLRATEINIHNAATVRPAIAFTNAGMSNRVHIACSNLTLHQGGQIHADSLGFLSANGPAPGTSGHQSGGAGHGGRGGRASTAGGAEFGTADDPVTPGSGGGESSAGKGGTGGGAIRIDATGTVTVNGTISANGGNANTSSSWSGGGAGGAIRIECATFGGTTNGLISANGGARSSSGGGGGGGRIAIHYSTLAPQTAVRFSAAPGTSTHTTFANTGWSYLAGVGTLYLSNSGLLSGQMQDQMFMNVRLVIPNFTTWNAGSLTVSNCFVAIESTNFTLTVANHLSVIGPNSLLLIGGKAISGVGSEGLATGNATNPAVHVGGNVILNGGTLVVGGRSQAPRSEATIGGNLVVTNSGALHFYSGATNGLGAGAWGGRLTVTGSVDIAAGSWIYPYSHDTDGGSPLFRMANLNVVGGGFDSNGRGWGAYAGRGATASTWRSGGAGHGGTGGAGASGAGGIAYGNTNAPAEPGSGGGGSGGGSVRVEASGMVRINGIIRANGNAGSTDRGGGSGGAVYIVSGAFEGDGSGIISASGGNGADANCGGGGGGRVAVWVGVPEAARNLYLQGSTNRIVTATTYPLYMGITPIDGGSGYTAGNAGTVFFFSPRPVSGSVFMIR